MLSALLPAAAWAPQGLILCDLGSFMIITLTLITLLAYLLLYKLLSMKKSPIIIRILWGAFTLGCCVVLASFISGARSCFNTIEVTTVISLTLNNTSSNS